MALSENHGLTEEQFQSAGEPGFYLPLILFYQNFLTSSSPVSLQKQNWSRGKGLFSFSSFLKCFLKTSSLCSCRLTFSKAVKWMHLLYRPFPTEGLKIKPCSFSGHEHPVNSVQKLSGQRKDLHMREKQPPLAGCTTLTLRPLFGTQEMPIYFVSLWLYSVRLLSTSSMLLTDI